MYFASTHFTSVRDDNNEKRSECGSTVFMYLFDFTCYNSVLKNECLDLWTCSVFEK